MICERETPPKKRIRLKNGMEPKITNNELVNPEINLLAINENAEIPEHISISNV
jgi:hypothetical protein